MYNKTNEINNNYMTTSQLKQYGLDKIRNFNSKPVMRKIKIITIFEK
jgi:hypothetical protein